MTELTKEEKKKGYVAKKRCFICGKWAYSSNPKLVPRHQHLGFQLK
jgi:hypothetical protein